MKPLFSVVCISLVLATAAAPAAQIVPIPFDIPARMSADGKWFTARQARWSPDEGFTNLGTMPGATITSSTGISADGSVVVGFGSWRDPTGQEVAHEEPFRWTQETGMVSLGALQGNIMARGATVSNVGSTVVGFSTVAGTSTPWIWTQETGMDAFALPSGAMGGVLSAVSGDGSVLSGTAHESTGNRGFTWDAQNGFRFMPPGVQNGPSSRISADGGTLIGTISPAPNNPYRWTRDEGVTVIGLPSQFGFAYSLTPDGSIIVGELNTEGGFENYRAFVWDQQHGAQDLRSVLIRDHGFSDLDLPVLNAATNLSADGRKLTAINYSLNPWAQYVIFLDKPLVNVVPEPSMYALSLAGVVVLVSAMRCRKRKRQSPG
jgi:uncharacterized membrane protein